MKKCLTVLIALLLIVSAGWAQTAQETKSTAVVQEPNLDSYIQVLRSNIRAQRVEIIAKAMDFKDAESSAFWPIYRNYELALDKLNDQRVVLLKDYADNLDKMTPAKAKALAEKSFALQQQKTDLKRKFFAEFEKALPANRVAKFFQVDHRLDLLVDLQLAAQLPLMD